MAQFPHYFLGANADLPIVGGSILGHDHFQGRPVHLPDGQGEIRFELYCPVDSVRACVVDSR